MANEFIVRKGLIVEGASGGTVVDIQGSQGQLFSVTDDLSGSIFAVSDISGVPIFDVNSSGVSYFDGNVGIGATVPASKLHVYGVGSSETHFTEGLRVTRETVPAQFGMFNYNGGALNIVATNTAGTGATTKFMRSDNGTTLSTSMVIDNAGNVGIGTTAFNNYWSGYTVLKLGADNGFFSNTASGAGSALFIAQNVYNDGSIYRHIIENQSGLVDMRDGKFSFLTSPSGAAGAAATMTNRFTILQAGNVGIGTTAPLANLDISNTTGGIYQQWSYDNPGANNYNLQLTETVTSGNVRFVFDQKNAGTQYSDVLVFNEGKIGIGTDEPGTKLDVNGAITAGTANSTSGSVLMYGKYSNGHLATIGTEYSNGGLVLGYGVTPSTTAAGGFVSSSAATNLTRGAYSFAAGTHKWWSDPVSTTIAVGTTSPLNNTMTLLDTGNLGIGTTTPYTKLVVGTRGTAAATSILAYDGIAFDFYNDGSPYKRHGVIISQAGDASESVLDFNTKAASGTNSTKMTILGDGNVGIGTTAPSERLQVDGRVMISSSTISPGIKFQDVGTTNAYIELANSSQRFDFKNDASTTMSLVLNTGNVGINTTSPNEKLQVVGNIQGGGVDQASNKFNTNAIFRGQNDGAAYINLIAKDNANSGLVLGVSASGVIDNYVAGLLYNNVTNTLNIHANNQNAIVIDSSQRVGINESAPTERLHVDGNARVTGAFHDSSDDPGTAGQVLSSTATGTNWVANNVSFNARADMFEIDNVAITSQGQGANINATQILTAGNVTRTAGTQMEVQTDGQYAVNFTFYLRTDYSVRQTMGAYLEVERIVSGNTVYIVIPGSLAATYTRIAGTNPGDQSSVTNSFFCDLKADDVLVLKLGRTDVNVNPISIGIVYPSGTSGTTGWPPTSTGNSKHHIAFRRVAVLT
jgi:hypothetical protein